MTQTASRPDTNKVYDPNQALEEKRAVRSGYRGLLEQAETARNEAQSAEFGSLSNLLTKSNELYAQVKTPSEGVLDSRVLISVAQSARVFADGLNRQSAGFDVDSFLDRVVRFVGRDRVVAFASTVVAEDVDELEGPPTADWTWDKLGRTAMKHSRRAPGADTLLGPFQQGYKKRHITGRRDHIDRADEAELPPTLSTNDIQKGSNNTTDKVIQVKELLDNLGEEGVSIFDFAFDPTSFRNTVENLFYISFLVRDGQCAMIMPEENLDDQTKVPMLMGCEAPYEEDYLEGLARRQIIMELDLPTWRAVIEQHSIQTCIIPHRERQAPVLQKGKWYA